MGCITNKRLTKISVASDLDESSSVNKRSAHLLAKSTNQAEKSENLNLIAPRKNYSIKSVNDFKITQGLLVLDSGCDPSVYYEKLKILGEGSFGTVFQVAHKQTGLIRAMKVIDKKSALLDKEAESSLINEINILKSLDHPNIIKVFEYFNTKSKLYIISELCTGGELFKKIQQKKRFSEQVAAHIMRQVFSAVAFCHRNKVIHRDLKPENILIESENEASKELFHIKIIDFGTSDVIRKNTMFTKQIGTPYYIAPEILNNSYNEKCDLWSCGVILYILLSGNPPFLADEDEEIYRLVKWGKYDLQGSEWDKISCEAKELIKSLLLKDISKRCSAEQGLLHPWFRKITKISQKTSLTAKASDDNLLRVAKNFKNFNANKKLQQAALGYLVHNMLKKEETEEFRRIFMEFDLNCDGRLTKEELISGLNKVMKAEEAKAEVDRIIDIIDVDGNGFIEYEEFLSAAVNKERILTEDNLKIVFDLFDKDKSGKISIAEIREMLGGNGRSNGTDKDEHNDEPEELKDVKVLDEVWEQMLKEMDNDGDGEVEFCEFKNMMNKIIDMKDQ